MGCNTCKQKPEVKIFVDEINNKRYSGSINLFAKILIFLIAVIIVTPLIIPITIIILFNVIILKKSLNGVEIVKFFISKLFKLTEEEDDETEIEEKL